MITDRYPVRLVSQTKGEVEGLFILGEHEYKMQLGRRAFLADLVKIFDVGPDVEPSSVEEQKRFQQEWLRSLGSSV